MPEESFTILMCTYSKDDPHLLEKAIESVFRNTTKPDSFILTIDGPIPKINQKIINRISKEYPIRLNYIKENLGLASALNESLKLVETKWIARADSDDINLKNRFAEQLKFVGLNIDVIGSNILEIDNNGGSTLLTKEIPLTNQEIRKYIQYRNPINHMTAFYKTDLIRSVGGYPDIYLREDYALWAKLFHKNAVFHNINKILVHVNGGKSLYKRRGGFKNAYAELKLQIILYKYKIKPLYLVLFHLILRTIILLLPAKVLEKIYILYLRKSI